MILTNRRLALLILVILVTGTAACIWTAQGEDRHMREQLLTDARLAAVGIPPEQITALSGSDRDLVLPEYAALKQEMTGLREAYPSMRFAYLIGKRGDGTYFFYVDSEPPDSGDYSPPGQPYPEATPLIIRGFSSTTALTGGPDSDRWGTWVSGVVPVTDPATGMTIALFGIDVDARDWYWMILSACLPPATTTLLILVLVLLFASYERRAEREHRQTLLFLTTQQALVLMARLPVHSVEEYMRGIIAIDARTILVDRVSIWMFSADHTEMVCSSCYTRLTDTLSGGMRLLRSDYPRYFAALEEGRIIAADEARTDERTREFTGSYLIPLDIFSMLDVPIRRGGVIVGIICHEQTRSVRVWDPLEQDFAASTADLIASALERDERITAEQALVESERRYRGVVEDQTELIVRIQPDGTLVFVNPAYCRFFSVARDQILGTRYAPVLEGDDRERFRTLVASLGRENPVAEITHKVLLGDGTERWLRWIVRAICTDTGQVSEYQAVGRDVTWQKHTEEALSLTNRKLSLLSSITRHDVLNQILILKGFLHLADTSYGMPDKFPLYMEKAMRAIGTIEAQINFTKTYQDMGSIAPAWQNVNLCIVRAKGALPAADIRVAFPRPGLEVFADPLLEKVFFNLFDNALRYGGETMTQIRIFSEEGPEGLIIVCEDDGAGIAQDDKRRLFSQGFGKNTGFGLFLSREILAISGIVIRETGAPGQGARFEIIVPEHSYRFRENGGTDDQTLP